MENKGYYIIMSQKTGKPYLTDDDHCKMFVSQIAAEKFCMDKEGLFVEGPNFTSNEDIMFSCKQAGALYLDICTDKKTDEKKIGYSPKKYFNRELNAAIFHLKDTKRSVYLKQMGDCMFIIPCLVEKGHEIIYGAAQIGDTLYTLAFSDLDEYNAWREADNYRPLELSFAELIRASAGREIIINISGYRYVLTRQKIDKVLQTKEEKKNEDNGKA